MPTIHIHLPEVKMLFHDLPIFKRIQLILAGPKATYVYIKIQNLEQENKKLKEELQFLRDLASGRIYDL